MSALLAIGAFLKPVGNLLGRISWQGWLCIACALAGLWLVHDRNHWKAVATERQASLVKLHATLDSISTKRDVQKQVSTRTVEKVVQGQAQVRTVVEHIHDAPNPPDCGTPDLENLRSVL
jgi:hypothetical protein